MSQREAFLKAIQLSPDDVDTRLVFADWLEEQGDPLAGLIRAQIQLERFEDRYGSEAEPYIQQVDALLEEHRGEWLGPLHRLAEDYEVPFSVSFCRGLPARIYTSVDFLLEHEELIVRHCPCLEEVVFYDIRNQAHKLQGSPILPLIRHLKVRDWLKPHDAMALTQWTECSRLERLSLFIDTETFEPVCETLSHFSPPRLKEIELVQLAGSAIEWGKEEAQALDEQAMELAALVDSGRKTSVATVFRPYDRLHPLREELGYLMYAGKLDGEEQALLLLYWDGIVIARFDEDGELIEETEHGDPQEILPESVDLSHYWEKEHRSQIHSMLKETFGFEPALIHVKEFELAADVGLYWCEEVDILFEYDEPLERDSRYEQNAGVDFWLEDGNFLITAGNYYWAGPDGMIHTS